MKEFSRIYPQFALCGLNCGLCPRYHTDGASRCPGCGGPDFHLKHPSCAVITCNRKHDNVEYCFQCSSYPCERYKAQGNVDSFITYKNVISDFAKAEKSGIEKYQEEMNRKIEILEFLVKNYNDGKRKNFYCLAVNLISLPDLEIIMQKIETGISKQGVDIALKIKLVTELIESTAKQKNIELKLRK